MDRQAGNLIKFIKQLRTVCFGVDDGGLSYEPYKQVVAVKSMNNYTNNEPHDPHGFKDQIKIKYEATKAIARKFPHGTAALMELLSKAQPGAFDWAAYCELLADKQLVWKLRANKLNQAILFLMNLKNKTAKKDLCLAYSQRNNTTYPINIEVMARYLSTQYSKNKPTNQRGGKKGDKKKGDKSKSEDKDSNMGGTIGVHVEDTTTTEESTVPNGAPSIGAHVSDTNVQLSNSTRTVEEILGAHLTGEDDFWGNTNPTDLSIDTANSEEMMAGSHITEFHSSKQEEPVIIELWNKVSNVPKVTRKHGADRGHHNQSDPQSAKSTDCKLNIRKDELFSSDTIGNWDVAKVMRKTLNMVGGFISDMLPKSRYLQAPTIVEDSNETTNGNGMRDLKPTAVDENNNDSVERANTVLDILVPMPLKKEAWFYQ